MNSSFSLYDRFVNPFEPKIGIDERPDFVPDEFYTQIKKLCNEAVLKIVTKDPLIYSIDEINHLIVEFEILFNETETFIKYYSGFDQFSFIYLELCEAKVFVQDYNPLVEKAINNFYSVEYYKWMEVNKWLYDYLKSKLPSYSKNHMKNEIQIDSSIISLYTIDLIAHFKLIDLFENNFDLK
jgi:hypothetical protein